LLLFNNWISNFYCYNLFKDNVMKKLLVCLLVGAFTSFASAQTGAEAAAASAGAGAGAAGAGAAAAAGGLASTAAALGVTTTTLVVGATVAAVAVGAAVANNNKGTSGTTGSH
jgi:hypothetical protein